jgi:hypothetical protein
MSDEIGISNIESIDVLSNELIEGFGHLALGRSEKRFAITGAGEHRHAELHDADNAREAGVVDLPIQMFMAADGTVRDEINITSDGKTTTATVNVV